MTSVKKWMLVIWDYLPKSIRPWFVLKVCLYGPESTGKSTLAKKLAERFKTEFVPEVAREFITSNNFSVNDIRKIGNAQYERIQHKSKSANKVLFCDTDLITTQIYSQTYLGVVPDVLYRLERKTRFDMYFLFDIDVPWVPDGLRDLGHKRKEMFRVFKNALDDRKIPYVLINGTYEQREADIIAVIEKMLS